MGNIQLGLEISSSGGAATVGEIRKIQEGLAQLKKQAADVEALAKALGTTTTNAKALADGIGLSAAASSKAITAIKDLKTVGTDLNTRFTTLNRGMGITAKQFEELERVTGTEVSELKKLDRALEISATEFERLSAKANEAGSDLNSFTKLGGAIAAGGIAAKVTQIGQAALQTGLTFEGLQATLENTLGSKAAADQVFGRLQTFAAQTPNQLDEVIQAFISLKQRGIEPTNDTLTKFGDIAASQGKPLQQFIEAVLDATTGDNGRLKELGIAAKTSGDKVTFSFQDVNKTVAKTPEAISGALLAFGQLDGVAGGMAKKAQTLGGQFSNLQDNTEALQNEMFGLVQGPMIAIVTEANNLIGSFRDLPDPIRLTVLGVAGFSGALVAAVAAVTAFNLVNGKAIVTTTLESAALVKDTIATSANAAAKFIAAAATGKLTDAQIANASSLALTAAKAGLVVGAFAAIALAVDTYSKVTEAAHETEKQTENLEKSVAALVEVEKKHADAAGKSAANQTLEAAALKRTQDQLGPIQNGLDVLRSLLNTISLRNLLTEFAKLDFVPEPVKNLINILANALPKVTTAAEESLREQAVAFEDQATKADEIAGKVFSLFSKGAKNLSDNELKLYKSAVDEATASIKAHIPIDQQDSDLKDQKLALLAKSKTLIDAETAARDKNKKATEGAAAAEQQAILNKAQAQADALKDKRNTAKEAAQEKFDQASRDRTDKANQAQRDRQERFNALQQTVDERYQAIKQAKQAAFQDQQNAKQIAFQDQLNAKQAAFDTQQEAKQNKIASAFASAAKTASQAEQLAGASTAQERAQLLKEFKRQAQQQKAVSKLDLANKDLDPSQILKLAQQVSGANLKTAEGAKQVGEAVQAIQAEQQKQQAEADRRARLVFELELQAQQKAFEQQQQAEAAAFDAQQRDIDDQFKELNQSADAAFAENERQLQRAFEEEGRAIAKAFKDQERLADLATAQEVQKILTAAKSTPTQPQARRTGGPIETGEPYLVGEAGPELIYPSKPGYVMTARETAAILATVPPPNFGNAIATTPRLNTAQLERQNETLITINRTLSERILEVAKRTQVVEGDHYYTSFDDDPLRGTGL